MPPTLPPELIKHILVLVYEGVREVEAPNAPSNTLPNHLDGEHVPHIFRPFLLVNKTFHALALPFLVRHLFARRLVANQRELRAHQKVVVAFVHQHNLGTAVKSIAAPSRLTETEQTELIRACSALDAVYLDAAIPSASLLLLPSTLSSLEIDGHGLVLTYGDLVTLQSSTPRLKVLGFGKKWACVRLELTAEQEDEYENFDSPWRLQKLDLGSIAGSAIPILGWLRDSATTLRRLSTHALFLHDRGGFKKIEYPLEELQHPLPSLVSLSQHWPMYDPSRLASLAAANLPNLSTLGLQVAGSALAALQAAPITLRRVQLTLLDEHDDHLNDALAIRDLGAFITTHPALELLELDFPEYLDETTRARGAGVWSEPLAILCAERGIVFGCNDHALEVNKGDDEYDMSEHGSSDDESSIGSSGIDEEMDFDAEDDKIRASRWSQEKREAMGVGELASLCFKEKQR